MTYTKLFMVYDDVNKCSLITGFAPTAGGFIRQIGSGLYKTDPDFEEHYKLFELGKIGLPSDEEELPSVAKFLPVDSPRFVSWNEFKLPESKVTHSEPEAEVQNI